MGVGQGGEVGFSSWGAECSRNVATCCGTTCRAPVTPCACPGLLCSLHTERAAAQDAAAAASTRITALEKEVADKNASLDDIRRRLRTCDGERLDALSNLKRVESELVDIVAAARRDKVR